MREKQETSSENLAGKANGRAEIEERIRTFRSQARKGSYGLVLFVLISTFAIPGFRFLPDLPEKAREVLGAPPKPEWIGMALAVYVFSALILALARIIQGTGGYRGWSHLFYITSFYIFFGFTETARESFWAVFVAGLIIFGLENFAVRTHSREMIEEEEEKLKKLAAPPRT